MPVQDHYATLGVLPDAEQVVIAAAYRALIQRYHPDKWSGEKSFAHERTIALNEAYRVLGDPKLRAEYDDSTRRQRQSSDFAQEENEDRESAFDSALKEVDERWKIACQIYPDLSTHRDRLSRVSKSLSFAFVFAIVERKAFSERAQLAQSLEHSFLASYFGTDERILDYARSLIFSGNRDAALALNKLVDVMGSNVDPELLIQNIESRFHLEQARRKAAENSRQREHVRSLMQKVRLMGYYDDAEELAQILGYSVKSSTKGLLRIQVEIVVTRDGMPARHFDETLKFINWVRNDLCTDAA